ncbi:MAG TPA: DoxX family protein [Thermoanaerobaculia bacterium]|nr:DoxX family protein [Thermoanaerobaculia bacterium]
MRSSLQLLSRIFLALIFVLSGVGKLTSFAGTAKMMGGVGFPVPELFLVGAILLELGGGLALLLGYKARWAALALIVFLIPATLIFHVAHMSGSQDQMIHALKNIAILGGLLKYYTDGPGAYAISD